MRYAVCGERELSAWYREMYGIPEDVPVFDRARPFTDDEQYTLGNGPDMGDKYWVHVQNTPHEWEDVLRREVRRDEALPEGYNNRVDVVESMATKGKMLIYMHYRPCATGLPDDF